MSASSQAESDDSYDVVVLGFEARSEPPAVALQRVFGVERATAEALVADLPAVVRRGVNSVRAEYFRKALVSIGARVEVRAFGLPLTAAVTEDSPKTEAAPPLAAIELPAAARPSDVNASPWGELQQRVSTTDSSHQLQPNAPARAQHEELELDAGQLALAHSPPQPDSHLDAAQLALASLPAQPARSAVQLDSGPPLLERYHLPGPSSPPNRAPPKPLHPMPVVMHDISPNVAAAVDDRSFWELIPEAFAVPWRGQGGNWLLAIGVVAVLGNVLAALARGFHATGVVAVIAGACVLALAADYHRVCMQSAANGDLELDEAPDVFGAIGRYLPSGVHIALFASIVQLPVWIWLVRRGLAAGAPGIREALGSPAFYWLALGPALYWPMAMATASLAEEWRGVWQLWVGLRIIARAPLEYALMTLLSALSFVLPWLACVLIGRLADLPVLFFAAAVSGPIAISHGVMGGLTGVLARARPDVFED